MDAGQLPESARDQVLTIHEMALHMHQIMQRFSSAGDAERMRKRLRMRQNRCLTIRFLPSNHPVDLVVNHYINSILRILPSLANLPSAWLRNCSTCMDSKGRGLSV